MKRSLAVLAAFSIFGSGAAFMACGGDSGGGGADAGTSEVTAADVSGNSYKYAVNSLTLPSSNKEYAFDLDGDGKADNQMGNIIGTLAMQGLDAQTGVAESIAEGDVVVLMALQTADASLKAGNAGLTFYLGKSFNAMVAGDGGTCMGCPDFSGMGAFTVDAGQAPAKFFGKLENNKFTSNNPVTTANPVSVTLNVALIEGAPPLGLTLNGARVVFTTGTDMKSGKPGLTAGQLNGSLKKTDIDGKIIPAVATLLDMRVKADPKSNSSMQILSIFDTGGCDMAKAKDGTIEKCEVATNPIIMAVLAPDVKVYDDAGKYAPGKGTKKDSLSFGLGWTAVQGMFTP